MTAPSPSFGKVPPKAIAALAAPFGKATSAIRNFIPDFTMLTTGTLIYNIEVQVEATRTFRVEAHSQKQAEEIAYERTDRDDFDFDICTTSYGPLKTELRIGVKIADCLAAAFNVSAELFSNLENAWLDSKGVEVER